MTAAPSPPARRRRWPRRLLVVAILLLGLYLARGRLLPAAARFLDVSEPPREVDAVMVLGGGASTRPFVAAALVRAGLARRALVPSVHLFPDQEDGLSPPEDEVLRRVLHVRGVPDDAVTTLPGEVDSTRDEARALARFLDGEPGATVAVVTNGFHTRRARMLFRHELGERIAQVHFVAAPTDRFDDDNWWRHEEGFNCYASEYFKLVYYGLREDRAWQAAVLAAAFVLGAAWLVRRRGRRILSPRPGTPGRGGPVCRKEAT
jgi:uncharacterized SAM-binding protein YcdF (DUF218 family)